MISSCFLFGLGGCGQPTLAVERFRLRPRRGTAFDVAVTADRAHRKRLTIIAMVIDRSRGGAINTSHRAIQKRKTPRLFCIADFGDSAHLPTLFFSIVAARLIARGLTIRTGDAIVRLRIRGTAKHLTKSGEVHDLGAPLGSDGLGKNVRPEISTVDGRASRSLDPPREDRAALLVALRDHVKRVRAALGLDGDLSQHRASAERRSAVLFAVGP